MLQKKMGLLVCDDVYKDYRSQCPDFLQMFSEAFPAIEFVPYNLHRGEFPDSLDHLPGYMMTGSRFSAYDQDEWIIRSKQLIRDIQDAGLLFVGVCFGHQMMAEALGGEVLRAPVGWSVGVQSFDIINHKNWIGKGNTTFQVQMMCQDQVHKLPPGAEIIAFRPECPVGIMQLGDKMLGIQGHPEFPNDYAIALIQKRRKKIGIPKADKALANLYNHSSLQSVKDLIYRFIYFSS
jgi:GMP synthase-like glutamine amidotransferase